MNNLLKKTIWIVFIFFNCNYAIAWENTKTHPLIAEYATDISLIGDGENYLTKLGLSNGTEQKFTWNNRTLMVKEWLKSGADLEDTGTRPFKHFHNPLKPWLNAGLWNKKQSAILWAQSYEGSQQPMLDDWSWQRTRKLYYLALTSTSSTVRSAFFAETFRGLGQQMHLLQDMAVPTHVRNDAHPLDYFIGTNGSIGSYFETWTKNEIKNLDDLEAFAPIPIKPTTSLSSDINYARIEGYLPVALLSDTNTLTVNTLPVAMNETATGLAEWTNSNFFSDDTINLPYYANTFPDFKYPNSTNTNLQALINETHPPETIVAEDNVPDKGFYVKKVTAGVEEVAHFARAGYMTREIDKNTGNESTRSKTFVLDDECHKDYAKLLLPRAVGYSAELLDHFFRGEINFVEADPNNKPNEYVIKNESEDEAMSGTFSLYYDDKEDNRILLSSWVTPTILPGEQYPGPDSDPAISLTFTVPSMDVAKESGTYILVFQGKLGNENNAVVGRVIRSFREEWNNGLRGNHLWLTTGQVLKNVDFCGEYKNEIVNGVLTKENTIPGSGCTVLNSNWTGLYHSLPCETEPNKSCVLVTPNVCKDCFPEEFGKEFPYPVNASTWLDLKVEMSSTLTPDCVPLDPDSMFAATQCVKYSFTDKNKKLYYITFAADDLACGAYDDDDKYYYDITDVTTNIEVHIYTMLADLYKDLYKDSVPPRVFDPYQVEPFMLKQIEMLQVNLNPDCRSSKLKMDVDYLRVMDK